MAPDRSFLPLVVQITDATALPESRIFDRLDTLAHRAAEARARSVVLLRDPELPSAALLDLARRLRERTRALGARLWVNDRLDVAALVEADGVHLGRRSVGIDEARRFLGDRITISIACHHADEVVSARDRGADAVTLSPIFASPGKGAPLGLEALAEARARLGERARFSLIALGGVDASRAEACFSSGADAVAAIRGDLFGLSAHQDDATRWHGGPR